MQNKNAWLSCFSFLSLQIGIGSDLSPLKSEMKLLICQNPRSPTRAWRLYTVPRRGGHWKRGSSVYPPNAFLSQFSAFFHFGTLDICKRR